MRIDRIAVAVLAVVALALSGCSNSEDKGKSAAVTTAPMTAPSAPAAQSPTGQVVAAPDFGSALAIDSGTQVLAALSTDSRRIALYRLTDSVPSDPRLVELDSPARALGTMSDGRLQVVLANQLVVIDTGAGTEVSRWSIPDGKGLSATTIDGGRSLVGTEDGRIVVFDGKGAVTTSFGGIVRVDALASRNGQVLALDKAQSLVASIDVDKSNVGLELRAGNGASAMTVDKYGRFLVTNARDGQLLAFTDGQLMNRFRFPLPEGPYGVAYDNGSDIAWVTTTANNRVLAFSLNSGIPEQRRVIATVRQPNSVAVNEKTRVAYVLSATGDGIQVIR